MNTTHYKALALRLLRFQFGSLGLALTIALTSGLSTAPAATPTGLPFKALLFSKTSGYRHASIPDGIAAIQQLAAANNFQVVSTEDATVFTDAGLAPYQVVIFLLTSGDVLDQLQQDALTRFLQSGRGFVGIHSACATEQDWPWYGSLVGGYYRADVPVQWATIRVEDPNHPSTRSLPSLWVRNDEWYDFSVNPRTNDPGIHVLATVDESTYSGGSMGEDHPIAWYHESSGGRAWYTGGGHTPESYYEALFRLHLLGGIRYAAGPSAFPPPRLMSPVVLNDRTLQLTFTNESAATFNMLSSTNAAAPSSEWTLLGAATPLANDVYQFLDSRQPAPPKQFYQLRAR
jgi:type 1 glutamine amidotransferase